jgi:hypothetical protein
MHKANRQIYDSNTQQGGRTEDDIVLTELTVLLNLNLELDVI